MLMEAMGLHVPGAAFVHPHDDLRELLTREAVKMVLKLSLIHIFHGFRASLQNIQLVVHAVFAPLNIHRAAVVLSLIHICYHPTK